MAKGTVATCGASARPCRDMRAPSFALLLFVLMPRTVWSGAADTGVAARGEATAGVGRALQDDETQRGSGDEGSGDFAEVGSGAMDESPSPPPPPPSPRPPPPSPPPPPNMDTVWILLMLAGAAVFTAVACVTQARRG